MTSLLEVAVTLVGVMLVLALAAQSVQEVVKASFALKGRTCLQALDRLVTEAARSQNQTKTDAEEIVRAVRRRLSALGQGGVRQSAVRLDAISAAQLGELIQLVSPDDVTSLRALDREKACERLGKIAERAVKWFPLAMSPVDDRYRRRMRGLAVLSSAIVVLGANANAFDLVQRARRDPEFRARVATITTRLDTLQRRADSMSKAPVDSGRPSVAPAVRAIRDSAGTLALQALRDDALISGPRGWQLASYTWWAGIILSIALVSLGAPFWHDTLEAMFGLKSRIRAQAKLYQQSLPSDGAAGPPIDLDSPPPVRAPASARMIEMPGAPRAQPTSR